MKKLVVIVLMFYTLKTYSQTNLVLNPSFETYTACPNGTAEISKALNWDGFNGTPDYFSACASNTTAVNVPNNAYGYQLAANGSCYGGLITYYNGGLAREIIAGKLALPLSISQKYYVSFKVNRGDDNSFNGYSTNKMGVRLSTVKFYTVNINNTAKFFSNTVITDTLNWVRVSGSFISDSAYQYLMIGNFFDDANTTVTNQSGGIYAYYFIDDVCLSTDSVFAVNYSTGIHDIHNTEQMLIYPNPAQDKITIKPLVNSIIIIYDWLGNEIETVNAKEGIEQIVCVSSWPAGVYTVKINNYVKKVLINNF